MRFSTVGGRRTLHRHGARSDRRDPPICEARRYLKNRPGNLESVTLAPESIETFRSEWARRLRLVILLTAMVEAVGFGALAWIILRAAEPGLSWVLVYLAVVGPSSLALIALVFRRSAHRLIDFLNGLAPRARLVSPPSPQGPFLLFDNDLVLRFQPATSFRLFFSPSGDPLSPDASEAKRWLATIRLRRVLQVTRQRGDPSLRAGLDAISSRLSSRWARLDVFDRTRIDTSHPRSPNRDAQAVFFLRDAMKSAPAIVRELDSIRELLTQAASTASVGLPRSIR